MRELEQSLEESDGIQRRGVVLAYLMKFKQICNHPAQVVGTGDYSGERERQSSSGLAALCEEPGRTPGEGARFHSVSRDHRPARAFS